MRPGFNSPWVHMKKNFNLAWKSFELCLQFLLEEFPNILQIITGFIVFGFLIKLQATGMDGKVQVKNNDVEKYVVNLSRFIRYCYYILSCYLIFKFIFFFKDRWSKIRDLINNIDSKIMVYCILVIFISATLTTFSVFVTEPLSQIITENELLRLTNIYTK